MTVMKSAAWCAYQPLFLKHVLERRKERKKERGEWMGTFNSHHADFI